MSDYDPMDNPIVRLHAEKIADWKRSTQHVHDFNKLRALILWALSALLVILLLEALL